MSYNGCSENKNRIKNKYIYLKKRFKRLALSKYNKMCRGVKYNLFFKNKEGLTEEFKRLQMRPLLEKIESLLKTNYNLDERISNQTIYNLQKRPENVSKLLKLFVEVRKC